MWNGVSLTWCVLYRDMTCIIIESGLCTCTPMYWYLLSWHNQLFLESLSELRKDVFPNPISLIIDIFRFSCNALVLLLLFGIEYVDRCSVKPWCYNITFGIEYIERYSTKPCYYNIPMREFSSKRNHWIIMIIYTEG